MRITIGRVAIFLVSVLGFLLSVVYPRIDTNANITLLIWTLILFTIGIYSFRNAKLSFWLALVFYIISIIVKYILMDGEYMILYLVHVYFITSTIIGIWGSSNKVNVKK